MEKSDPSGWLTQDPGAHRRESQDSRAFAKDKESDQNSRSDEKAQQDLSTASRAASNASALVDNGSTDPREGSQHEIVVFKPDDPDNPYNWSSSKKMVILASQSMTVINSTLGSSLPSGATKQLAEHFNVTDQYQLVVVLTIYIAGYVFGPLLFGPLSEHYGRKLVMVFPFTIFTIFTMAAALAPNWAALNIFRFITGLVAAAPIAVVGGVIADIYKDPVSRGRAMAAFMAATALGPCIAAFLSGYLAPISWRWPFWAALIVAGVTWVPLIFLPETYTPTLLTRRAKKLRKETGNRNFVAEFELESKDIGHIVTTVLTRPLRMLIFEPLVSLTCLYLSLIYGIFYLFFESYPIIFEETYGFTAGEEGLTFLAIGVGSLCATGFYAMYDIFLQRARARDAPWSRREESRRLPLGCIGGPMILISLFWCGWTATPSIHWIVPTLAGIPFGIGFLLIFMSLLNYMVDAYKVYAASAMAATSATRSVFGVLLPLAGRPMYETLGVAWACSLLGFLMIAMCFIPPLFWVYGEKIRARSPFCQSLLQQEQEAERQTGTKDLDGDAKV